MIRLSADSLVHVRELTVFACVGALATLTHYLVALYCVEQHQQSVYLANIFAYSVAVFVSFIGHSLLTFRKRITVARGVRFAVVSLSALGFSQLILGGLQAIDSLGHRLEFLVVVFFVPAYSYVLNKFWVYGRET